MSPMFSRDGVLCGASKYTDDNEADVIAYERLENGEWIVEQAVVGNYAPYYSQMDFAFDSLDSPAISWGDYNDGAVHLAAKREGVWQHEVVAPGGLFAPRTELFFDSQDRAVISFSYITDGGGDAKIAREALSGWDIIDPPIGGYVALRPNDNILVSSRSEDKKQLLLAEFVNSDWQQQLIYEALADERTVPYDLAVTTDGMARILHWGGSSVGLQMAREQDDGEWDLEPIEGYPEDYHGVSLALGPDDIEMLLFIPQDVETEPAMLGWYDGFFWGFVPVINVAGWENNALLIHPNSYPAVVTRQQLAAYW